jgi:CubicO group peptidase (beta-lactamase class C family)
LATTNFSIIKRISTLIVFASIFLLADAARTTWTPSNLNKGKGKDWTSMEQLLFPQDAKKPFFSTDALLILRHGHIEYERYWNGNRADTPHILWSVSKSISSLIWGAAFLEGSVDLHSSLCATPFSAKYQINCQITWDHLLSWSSGLSFLESYEGEGDRTQSSVGQMLYGDGKQDSVKFVLGHKQIYVPGTHYYYSTGDSTALLGLLKYVYGNTKYSTLPQKLLFQPLEMNSAAFERDISDQFLGGSSAYSSARDLAKIGGLILNKGSWEGQQIVAAHFLDYLLEENPNWKSNMDSDKTWIPLRHWWKVNVEALDLHQEENFPRDVYAARGHWGQYLIVIPSRKMVLVRFGLDLDGRLDIIEILKRALRVLEDNP